MIKDFAARTWRIAITVGPLVAIALSLLSPVIPPSLGFMRFVLNYSAVLCIVLGLSLIRLAKTLAKRATKQQAGMT